MPHSTFLQAGSAIPSTPIELVRSATVPTQIVLVLLVLLSLTSWGIMLAKWLEFRRMHAEVFSDLQLHSVDLGKKTRHRSMIVCRIGFDVAQVSHLTLELRDPA